jgi:hypothetical protein
VANAQDQSGDIVAKIDHLLELYRLRKLLPNSTKRVGALQQISPFSAWIIYQLRTDPGTVRYGRGGHEDGAPFDGTGIGREWLLLICERILYELGSRSVRKRKKKGGIR